MLFRSKLEAETEPAVLLRRLWGHLWGLATSQITAVSSVPPCGPEGRAGGTLSAQAHGFPPSSFSFSFFFFLNPLRIDLNVFKSHASFSGLQPNLGVRGELLAVATELGRVRGKVWGAAASPSRFPHGAVSLSCL